MFQQIRDLVADVCRYEETAPINSACMRCILLWSAVVLVMLNLSYNSFDRPIVFVSTLFICLTLFGVSLLLSHVRHPKRTVLAGAVLIVLMSLCSFVSNENDGFQTLWLFLLPAILLIQLGLKQAVPICSAYGLCAMVLLWGSPERLANAYPRDYRIYYPVFYWEFLLAMVVADLFYKSYRIRREQTEQEMEAEVQATMGKAQKLILSSVAAINQMIDEKDHYTSEHSRRVAQYSRIIAKHLDPTLSEEELERLYRSALLHDIGKIAVPDAILNKSSRLTDAEIDVMRQHTLWGKKNTGRAGISAPGRPGGQLPPRAVRRHRLPRRADGQRSAPHGVGHRRSRRTGRHELQSLLPQALRPRLHPL